ncbi:hypothetical protein LJC31_04940 [Synergistaceae bacterium OttesenSCG-928-I11]|nr:hypothetical protein [Synergistaceae bacterium OttesenSCG-928-I11]
MKRFVFTIALCFCLFSVMPAETAANEKFSAADLKRMSTFLSNFTEVGLYAFDAKEITNDPYNMNAFGVLHNYINNKKRISGCGVKNCEWGPLVIDGKYVAESAKKYFGVAYKPVSSTDAEVPYYYDGKRYHFGVNYLFEMAGGKAEWDDHVYARVDKATRNAEGLIVMIGEIYRVKDENFTRRSFEAVAKPHRYDGKDTWAIVDLWTDGYY